MTEELAVTALGILIFKLGFYVFIWINDGSMAETRMSKRMVALEFTGCV